MNVVQKTKLKNSDNERMRIIGAISALAVVAVIAVIAFVMMGNQSSVDYSKIHMERSSDGAFILGDPDAKITIVAWEDFLCPHCQDYESTIEDFIQEFVATGQARFEFRMLIAIDQTYSALAFQLAECSEELQPNSFFKARATMFHITSTSRFSQSSGREFASQMGLTYGALLDCTSGVNQYTTDIALAQQFGDSVSGTPSVGWRLNGGEVRFDFINRQPTVGEIGALIATFANQ